MKKEEDLYAAAAVNNLAVWDEVTQTAVKSNSASLSSVGNMEVIGGLNLGVNRSVVTARDYGYLDNIGGGVSTDAQVSSYSLKCASSVLASTLFAYSSRNIKNILGEGEEIEKEAVDLFLKIPFKKYEYKDKFTFGHEKVFGMIAEELQEIMPHSVKESASFLPNIMQLVSYKTFNDNLSYLVHAELKHELGGDIQENDKIKLLDAKGEAIGLITSIKEKELVIRVDRFIEKELFVYGTIGSCPTVNKEAVFEMGMLVLQGLIKKLKEKKVL